jgi:hypothetical protein
LIQSRATAGNIAAAALELLADPACRNAIRAKLDLVIQSPGDPGAARRAAAAILKLMKGPPDAKDVSRVIKSVMKDYQRTMRRLA